MMPMRNTLAKTTHRAVDAASLDLTDERTEMSDATKQQCAHPDASTCAKLWEADHQRKALEQFGLADEFPFGCDAIEHVAEALVAARKQLAEQRAVVERLRDTARELLARGRRLADFAEHQDLHGHKREQWVSEWDEHDVRADRLLDETAAATQPTDGEEGNA